jgi:hypothetical protein
MKGITVCVDYWDYLEITLPKNLHHFEDFLVVTAPQDTATQELCKKYAVKTHITDAFYRKGAHFNKWLALEEGLDVLGRLGWLCIIDSDIIMPEFIYWPELINGKLYAPRRRMTHHPLPENQWGQVPLWHVEEFSGYFQLFNGLDEHLPNPPWHELDWMHAGGADTAFQALWPVKDKVRLPFEVLHLGPNGKNWLGRATPIKGKLPTKSQERLGRLSALMELRRQTPKSLRQYEEEKIKDEQH